MPNRLLKETIKTSPQIDQLTWFEEALFYRLLVNFDDYGCCDGRPVVLKSELFPTKENVTKTAVEKALKHLEDVGLITQYSVGDRPYIMSPTWEKHQRIRNKNRKFPAPPKPEKAQNQALVSSLLSNDSQMSDGCQQVVCTNPIQSNPTRIQVESESESESNQNCSTADEVKNEAMKWFEVWWKEYPRKIGKRKCRERFLKIVTSEEKFEQLMAALYEQNKVFFLREIKYIPLPETWLNQERWEDELQPDYEKPKNKETDWSVFENWPAQ